MLMKAALFTSVVTSFTLDAMSDLDEDTSTKLLRIIAEQSTVGLGIDIPQPNPPKSIVVVTGLWLFSMMFSLTATTWAILSLEWCTFFEEGVQAEDYEEMAEKRQEKFEAVGKWKMHMIVASIPLFLHISLFLFLGGLWLRLRDVNWKLELVVGIPALVIWSSYVIVTLIPVFTDAPFTTSVSELLRHLVDEIKELISLRRFVYPPPMFSSISSHLRRNPGKSLQNSGRSHHTHTLPPRRTAAIRLISFLDHIHQRGGRLGHDVWTVLAGILRPILPTYRPGGNIPREMRRLRTGLPPDPGVQQRALFRLMNTPLTHPEVKDVLNELRLLGSIERPLDRGTVKLLVLSLSSILGDGRITEDERPSFDHCTRLLTEEMDRAFREAEYNPTIVARDTVISERLNPFLDFDTSHPPPETESVRFKAYWDKAVRLLWLSPSKTKLLDLSRQLGSEVARSMEPPLLQRVIRGLHAATITSLDADQSILTFPPPDFSCWDFSGAGWASELLDRDLLAYLQNILTEFHKSVQPHNQEYTSPATTSSLIIGCLQSLDGDPQRGALIPFDSAVCFFITVAWRSDPGMFGTGRPVARALARSAVSAQGTLNCSKKLAIRLRTIANGPKYLTAKPNPQKIIANLYHYTGPAGKSPEGAPDSGLAEDDSKGLADPGRSLVEHGPMCLPEFIHAAAATLEALLSGEAHRGVPDLRPNHDNKIVQNIVPVSFFTDPAAFDHSDRHPDHRLPYLYSLAIVLSRGVEVPELSRVLRWLGAPGEQKGDAAIESILDTNTLVVTVFRLAIASRRADPALTGKELGDYSNQITETLQSLQDIIGRQEDYSWQTRWKSIYLVADIKLLLNRASVPAQLQTVVEGANRAVETYISEQRKLQADWEKTPRDLGEKWECVPCDWEVKKGELTHCGVVEEIRELGEAREGVYKWKDPGRVPHLSLYPQGIHYDSTSWAPYRLLGKLQQ